MPIKSTLVSSQIKPCEAHVPSQDEWLVIQLQLHWMTLRSEWRCRMNKQMRPYFADRRTAAIPSTPAAFPCWQPSCIMHSLGPANERSDECTQTQSKRGLDTHALAAQGRECRAQPSHIKAGKAQKVCSRRLSSFRSGSLRKSLGLSWLVTLLRSVGTPY